MTISASPASLSPARRATLRQAGIALRLALRDLRSGLGGFAVFIACLALGVGVITAVGALADALRAGFEQQGEAILGGDATLARIHQRASAEERSTIDRLSRQPEGRASETATLRSMARLPDGRDQTLIELKAVDDLYPLAGAVRMQGGADLQPALRAPDSAVVDPLLLARLGLAVGDRFKLGSIEVTTAGVIEREPDTISDRVLYGPRVLVSLATLTDTGLVQPGTLIRWRYALKLPAADPAALTAFRTEVARALPGSGFAVADRRDPSPDVTRTIDRLRQFLTLIGLNALLIGGLGVANAVAAFIDRRRRTIAVMKSLGATGPMVFAILFTQVMLIAAIGIAIGLALGCLVPPILDHLYADALPIRAVFALSWWSVLSAIVYGGLVAAVFTLWPLGRAGRIRAGVLFRDAVVPERAWPGPAIVALSAIAVALLVAFAILAADRRMTAVYYLAAVAIALVVFAGLGHAVTLAVRRLPKRWLAGLGPEVRLAATNIGAPDGLTRSVILSLGAGLSLLVAITLADASLTAELTTRLPTSAPTWFVLDLRPADRAAFVDLVHREAPAAEITDAPMLRGRITGINGVAADTIRRPNSADRADTERSFSYSQAVPAGSRVVAGDWWPAEYAGEPLVSLDTDLARRLDVKLGDRLTVNVLGRDLTAKVASLREIKWEHLAINFGMVFSPNTLQAAPHNLLATVTLPQTSGLPTSGGAADDPALEARVARALAAGLPGVSLIRVKDAVVAFQTVVTKVMTAIRVAGSVALLAGALVLAGALATAQQRRVKQAVILKTLGATRRRILVSHLIEYGALAAITALLATAIGSLTAWLAVTRVMELEFVFSPVAVALALGLALGLMLAFGSIGTWRVLRAPAAAQLRAD